MKFGMQIDFRLLKQMPSVNLNQKLHFRLFAGKFDTLHSCQQLWVVAELKHPRTASNYEHVYLHNQQKKKTEKLKAAT